MRASSANVIWVSKIKYSNNSLHIHRHYHNCYHLMYLIGGKGTFRIGEEEYDVQENDIYLVRPGICHETVSNPPEPVRTIEVKFLIDDEYLMDELNKLAYKVEDKNNKVRRLIEEILEEAVDKQDYYKEIITHKLLNILLEMLRSQNTCGFQNDREEKYILSSKESDYNLCSNILKYINKNYYSDISLDDLARMFSVNRTYLCRLFKNQYNITPIKHMLNLRLQKAKELLTYSDLNITEISERVGFQSVHYFSRYFSAREKISPLEYRHNVRDCIYITVDENGTPDGINVK